MAEREGFEPSVEVAPYNGLAGRPVQPLQHLSGIAKKKLKQSHGQNQGQTGKDGENLAVGVGFEPTDP